MPVIGSALRHALARCASRPETSMRVQYGQRAGVDRVAAQLVAWESGAIDEPDAHAGAREHERRRAACRAGTDDEHVSDRHVQPSARSDGPAFDTASKPHPRTLAPSRPRTLAPDSHPRTRPLCPSEHERAVLRSEAETVAQRGVDVAGRAVFGMKSMSQAGSGSSRLIVGGSTPASSPAPWSRRPPRRSRPADGRSSTWSTSPAHASACAPKTRRTQRDSMASFSCVEVP